MELIALTAPIELIALMHLIIKTAYDADRLGECGSNGNQERQKMIL